MKRLLLLLALCAPAFGQTTTTYTGTVKDLSGAAVTSGQVSFTLQPGIDTIQSGIARFTSTEIDCSITGVGAVKALDGVSSCVVTNNTSLQPSGTSYKVCIQPAFVTPGSCFVTYAIGGTVDITQQVPTPPGVPAYNLVDTFSNQTINGNKTFTGTVNFGPASNPTFASLSGIQYVATSATDLGPEIAAACAVSTGSGLIKVTVPGGGTISTSAFNSCSSFQQIQFGCGNWVFTGAAVNELITASAVKILGSGRACTAFFIDSPTADFLTVSGSQFELANLRILPKSGVLRTAGATVKVTSSTGSVGDVHDVELRDMFDGFVMDGPSVSSWRFNNIESFTDGGNWHNLFRTHASSSTATSFSFHTIFGNWTGTTPTGAVFDFQSLTDTASVEDVNFLTKSQPGILTEDNDNVAPGQWPRWVHFTNSFIEAAGSTVFQVNSCRDCTYENSYASGANVGIAVGANARGTKIIGNVFPNLQQQGITIALGANGTEIVGNTFDGTSFQTNNTYPIIDVAAGASDWQAINNTAFSFGTNKPPNCVNIAAGASTSFAINHFDCQNVVGASVANNATGAQWSITDVTGFQDSIKNAAGTNFVNGVALGGEQVSKAPRAVWSGFATGIINGVGNLGPVFTPDQPITITRFTIFQQTTGTCTTFPTISIFAGSALSSITTSTTQTLENSGLSINVAAGTQMTIRTTGAATCTTNPANVSVTVEYKMQ